MLFVLFALYNVVLNSYSILYVNIDIVFNYVQYISFVLLLPVFAVPYHILSDLKYDLYHNKLRLTWFYRVLLAIASFQVLWFYVLKYYDESRIICDVLYGLMVVSALMAQGLPFVAERSQQRQFITECTAKNESILWSNYIIHNSANYQGFVRFLADVYSVSDLLFMIDVIQFKNKLKALLQERIPHEETRINYGYMLPFWMTNEALPISPIVMDLETVVATDNKSASKIVRMAVIHHYECTKLIHTVLGKIVELGSMRMIMIRMG
eukprot:572760_1